MILKDKRIFFVEDNVANKTIMLMILEMAGATVGFDRSGSYAVERLKLFAPVDVILLDLMLPGANSGFDLYSAIRAVPDFATLPIIAVSATNPSEAIPLAKSLGFAGFIGKPVDQQSFPVQVQRILAGEKLWLMDGVEV
jgi:two-component system cell cycle response regulator DivK